MHNSRWIVIVAALAFAAVVGVMAYQAGVSQGVLQSGKMVAPAAGAYPYPYPYYGWHPWPFGFFFAPLFFFLFFCAFMRALFWGGRHHHGGCRQHEQHPAG